jgi:hypothetical protein
MSDRVGHSVHGVETGSVVDYCSADTRYKRISIIHILYILLRPILAGLVRSIDRLEHLPDGLRWPASRGAAPSFDELIADLAAQAQSGQFVGRLQTLVSELPLPEILPPAQIGKARRIDSTADICALAKGFSNCLATLVRLIDDGECVIYLWDVRPATAPAQTISLRRFTTECRCCLKKDNSSLG